MTGKWPKTLIDHENNIKSDNRWDNLRLGTKSKNAQNAKLSIKNKSGFKGVREMKDRYRPKPFAASICRDGRRFNLGLFATPEEAHEAYKAAALKLFGKFARFQ